MRRGVVRVVRPVIRRRLAARTAAVATAVALLAACSAEIRSGGTTGTSNARVTPARLSRALPGDSARMLFPATGAETRWTQGLDVFVRQVSRAAAAECAHDRGIGLPEQVPLAFIRFSEVPDLDFLARHGFGQSAPVPTPTARPVAAPSGSAAAVRACRAEGETAADTLRGPYAGLQGRWFAQLAPLRREPATARALRTLPGCFAGHGIKARDEDGFFRGADARLNSVTPVELPGADLGLGRAYADCMRPVEAVREPARLRLRERFLADHADDIRELRETLVPSLRRAEERYGLRLAFPAP
ncbi:hypothetical protein [Streptomyces sp. NPDC007264]|uniref:hypothetical protein n=1 Tax=Streptomyces sp. NPDC007264 TaxID=3364777 RepID=UPI0036DF8A02